MATKTSQLRVQSFDVPDEAVSRTSPSTSSSRRRSDHGLPDDDADGTPAAQKG